MAPGGGLKTANMDDFDLRMSEKARPLYEAVKAFIVDEVDPITEEFYDGQSGRVSQYFERARFERASASATGVALGLLGREAAGTRTFAQAQPIANSAQRRYFPAATAETRG